MGQLKKFSLRRVSEFLTEPEMKRVTGGYDTGNTCWHRCYTYGGTPTASVWGTCYEAYHECNRRFEIAECGCNG